MADYLVNVGSKIKALIMHLQSVERSIEKIAYAC